MSFYQVEFDTDIIAREVSKAKKSSFSATDFEPCHLADDLIPTAIQLAEALTEKYQVKGKNRRIILAISAWQAHAYHNRPAKLAVILKEFDLNPNLFHSLMKKVSPVRTGLPILQAEPSLSYNLQLMIDKLIEHLLLTSQVQQEIMALGELVQKHKLSKNLRPTAAALVVLVYFITHRSICTQAQALEYLNEFSICPVVFNKIYDLVDLIYNED